MVRHLPVEQLVATLNGRGSTTVAGRSRLSRELADTSDCESAPAGLVHSDCHVGLVVVSHRGPVLFDWEALAWDR
jgi:hypothetical protein